MRLPSIGQEIGGQVLLGEMGVAESSSPRAVVWSRCRGRPKCTRLCAKWPRPEAPHIEVTLMAVEFYTNSFLEAPHI